MTKFREGDEIYLRSDYRRIVGHNPRAFSVKEENWKIVENIRSVFVERNSGVNEYGGYRTSNAIIICDINGNNITGQSFPEEIFEIYRKDLFVDSTDFLI